MSANFLLDENIPYALIDLLERKGFSVDHLKKNGQDWDQEWRGLQVGRKNTGLDSNQRCRLPKHQQIYDS